MSDTSGQELVLSGQAFLEVIERAAKDPQVDVAKMEALFNLAVRVNAERAKAQFNAALSALQALLPVVDEDGVADFGGNDKRPYATFENIVERTRPLLSAHEFGITFSTQNDKPTEIKVTGTLRHAAGHTIDSSLTFPADASGKKNPVQALASAISYAERHIWKALLGIATRKADDDGEAAGAEEPVTPEQAREIEALLESTKADREKFLEWIGARSVETIAAKRYARAVEALRTKGKPRDLSDVARAAQAQAAQPTEPAIETPATEECTHQVTVLTLEEPVHCGKCDRYLTPAEQKAKYEVQNPSKKGGAK